MLLWVLRHLSTRDNQEQLFCSGDRDVSILPGQTIAKKTIEFITDLGRDYTLAHTGLLRTMETTTLLAEVVGYSGEIIVLPNFRERFGGRLAGLPFYEIQGIFPQLQEPNELWKIDNSTLGLELVEDFLQRIESGLCQLTSPTVLVAHAGSLKGIKAVLEYSDKASRELVLCEKTPGHGAIYQYEI